MARLWTVFLLLFFVKPLKTGACLLDCKNWERVDAVSIACYRYTPENTWSKKNGARKRKRQLCVVCHTVEEKRHLQNPLARPAQAILLDNRKYYHFVVTAVTCCCLSSFVYFVPYFYSMAHKKNGMLPLMQNAVVVGVNPTSGISVSLLSFPLSLSLLSLHLFCLQSLLTDDNLQTVPFLVLGNKIDMPAAVSEDELR